MNLQQLETFRHVVELASFTKAAVRLNTTQSTVSMRISDLEQELGVQLLDRSRRHVQATNSGRELLSYAGEMSRLRQEIIANIGHPERFSATIRLGVAELVALTWLPDLVAQINAVYPNVEVDLDVGLSGDYFNKTANRDFDLLFLATDGSPLHGLIDEPLYKVDFCYMASPSLNLHGSPLSPTELEKCSLISLGQSSALASIQDRWLQQNHIRPKKIYRTNSMEVSAGLVRSGLGISFLPVAQYSKDIAAGRLVVLETQPPMPKVQFSAVYSDSDVAPQIRITLKLAHRVIAAQNF